MGTTITITNPKYIQFKDDAGALHYYQHYPPIEKKDVTDYIFYTTKPYGYNVRSRAVISGFTETIFCLYIYYTKNFTEFKNNSNLQGRFTESAFDNQGSLNLEGLEE